MRIKIRDFLDHAGVEEAIYPGKWFLLKCRQPGEFKSHSVVIDWKDPLLLHLELKPGLTGHALKADELKKYPVSFQARTFVDIAIGKDSKDNHSEEEDGEDGKGKSSGGGGGRRPAKKLATMGGAFAKVMEGSIPEAGEIKKLVVLGKEIAKEAYGQVLEKLAEQMKNAKIVATDLLAESGKFITRYTPPAFLQATGNEDAKYKYDRLKNETMFGGTSPG